MVFGGDPATALPDGLGKDFLEIAHIAAQRKELLRKSTAHFSHTMALRARQGMKFRDLFAQVGRISPSKRNPLIPS